jgi:hypothetical protein
MITAVYKSSLLKIGHTVQKVQLLQQVHLSIICQKYMKHNFVKN